LQYPTNFSWLVKNIFPLYVMVNILTYYLVPRSQFFPSSM
jgi:hypothetical protein